LLLNWDIDEDQINEELDRQEMKSVNLLFAYKWFYSDITNKGKTSKLVSQLLHEDNHKSQVKSVKTENELMTLCYMSYLETNHYHKVKDNKT